MASFQYLSICQSQNKVCFYFILLIYIQGFNSTLTGSYSSIRAFTQSLKVRRTVRYNTVHRTCIPWPDLTWLDLTLNLTWPDLTLLGNGSIHFRQYRLQVCGWAAGEPDVERVESLAGNWNRDVRVRSRGRAPRQERLGPPTTQIVLPLFVHFYYS